MTEPNPLPSALSHLSQRDAAVRARALEKAAAIRAELVAALRAMMTGSEYGSTTWDGEVHPPKWTVIRMPTKEALDQARAAIARADAAPGEQP